VPKHVDEIKDYTVVHVLVALVTENKSRNLTSTSSGIFTAWCLTATEELYLGVWKNGWSFI